MSMQEADGQSHSWEDHIHSPEAIGDHLENAHHSLKLLKGEAVNLSRPNIDSGFKWSRDKVM